MLKNIYGNTKISSAQQRRLEMPGIKSKITRDVKKQGNTVHHEEKKKINNTVKSDKDRIISRKEDKTIITVVYIFKKTEMKLSKKFERLNDTKNTPGI